MSTIDFSQLSEADKALLIEQLENEKKVKREKRESDKKDYEEIKEGVVTDTFAFLKEVSDDLTASKDEVFKAFDGLLSIKKSILNLSDADMEKQQTHTFSNSKGITITIGNNVVDGYDPELLTAGVAKVNNWLDSKTTDENQVFVGMIRDLLRPNKQNVLKASRVLELGKRAKEIGDVELIEAVELLMESYKPVKTSTFVKASFKNEKGKQQWLALSMSMA